jgi:hypothetical protein
MSASVQFFNADFDMRKFRATVRNEFLQMKRVKAVKNIDPVEFLKDYVDTINAYFPDRESALMVLGDDFECVSRWALERAP